MGHRILDFKPDHEGIVIGRLAAAVRQALRAHFPDLPPPPTGAFADDVATAITVLGSQPAKGELPLPPLSSSPKEAPVAKSPPRTTSGGKPQRPDKPAEADEAYAVTEEPAVYDAHAIRLASRATTLVLLSLVVLGAVVFLLLLFLG